MSEQKKDDSSEVSSGDELDLSEELERQLVLVREKSAKKKAERLSLRSKVAELEAERERLRASVEFHEKELKAKTVVAVPEVVEVPQPPPVKEEKPSEASGRGPQKVKYSRLSYGL